MEKMKQFIYEAVVLSVDLVPGDNEGSFYKLIKVKPKLAKTAGAEKYAWPPSNIPFTLSGGGTVSYPAIGNRCVVLTRHGSRFDQILTYTPYEAAGPEGIYTPEVQDPGGMNIKIGGKNKSLIGISPNGEITLYSDTNANMKLNGLTHIVEINTYTYKLNYRGGFSKTVYSKKHNMTEIADVIEHTMLVGKTAEKMMFSDYSLETEEINLFATGQTYTDKVLIRAGTIYNNTNLSMSDKETGLVGHVYQIETRQNTISSTEKDTVSILRLGYQKDRVKKYADDTKYAAGTIYEFVAKRVDPIIPPTGGYSSWLHRYGKLEGNTTGPNAENMAGEIYRNQIYQDSVEGIGTTLVDPLGKGKGWKYELNNFKITEQYTESFGALVGPTEDNLSNSFYHKHAHYYPGLSLMTAGSLHQGTEYTFILGGKGGSKDIEGVSSKSMLKYEKISKIDTGKSSISLDNHFIEDGTVLIQKTSFISGSTTEQAHEKIQMSNKEMTLEVVSDKASSKTFKIVLSDSGIKISISNSANTPSIELKETGEIVLSPAPDGNGILVLGNDGYAQPLVTKSWVDMIFATHMHPTASPGPPSPPIPVPPVQIPGPTTHLTYTTKAQ